MFWFKKKEEAPKPLNSSEYEKLSILIIGLNTEIKLLKGDLAGLELEMTKMKNKVNAKFTKTPEEANASSGLPTTAPKGLNTFNPFL